MLLKSSAINILLVEDDLLSRIALGEKLKHLGKVILAGSCEEAKAKLKRFPINIAFVDLDLDRELEGLTLISLIKKLNSYVVILSAREEESVIRKAYDLGCDDYLAKPFNQKAIDVVFRKFNQKNLKDSVRKLLVERFHTTNKELLSQVDLISNSLLSDRPILIQGETGTGKTYLAKTIHELSGEHRPFIQLNCSEFSENLLESELFGHVAGAYTGAQKNKRGMLELAHDGILFLDEIATMSENLQKKILKAIEEKEFYPVGGEKPIKSQFRLISATCEDLQLKVANGSFRHDLYYRVIGFNLNLMPLRERKEDIRELLKYFIKTGERRFVINEDAIEILINYSWPGNMRELQKMVEILRTRDEGIVSLDEIKQFLLPTASSKENVLEEVLKIGLSAYVEKMEVKIVEETYLNNQKKVRKTLNDLKMSNNSFYRIMDKIKLKNSSSYV